MITFPPNFRIKTLAQLEKEAITITFSLLGGRVSEVASALGLSRATLYRKLKQYKIKARAHDEIVSFDKDSVLTRVEDLSIHLLQVPTVRYTTPDEVETLLPKGR